MNVSNVFSLLEIATMYAADRLVDVAIQFIEIEIVQLYQSEGFEQAVGVATGKLQEDFLRIISEFEEVHQIDVRASWKTRPTPQPNLTF